MNRGTVILKAALAASLIGALALAGACESNSRSKSGATSKAEPGRAASDERANPWTVDDKSALPPSPLRGAAAPKSSCIPAGMVRSSLAFPTGDRRSSGLLVESGLPKTINKGEEFDYIICVTNLTNTDLESVMVTDEFSSGFELISSTPKYSSRDAGAYVWSFDEFPAGDTQRIMVRARATSVGSIHACTTATYNQGFCVATNVVEPALQLAKTGPDAVSACDEIILSYTVKNTGTGPATNVVISDNLASGLTTKSGKRAVSITVGTLAAGQSKTFNVPTDVSKPGRYQSKATASASPSLKAESKMVSTRVSKPVLKITQNCEGNEYLGRNTDIDITVSNTGDGAATGTKIVATLPTGGTFVRASDGGKFQGGKVVWPSTTIAPKASKKVSYVYSAQAAGNYRAASSANAACADAVDASCQTEYRGIPAILLEVVDLIDPVELGDTTTYVITATNQGSADDKNIKITATLDDSQSYVSSDGATKGTARGREITFAPLKALAPGKSATWRITIRADKVDDARFMVTMSTDRFKREPVRETESTNLYE